MRRSISILAALAAIAVLAAPVAAARPERVFLEAETFELPAGTSCEFTLRVEFLANKEFGLFFPVASDGSQQVIVTGHLVQRITNVETGASIDVNVSGPGKTISQEDGSAVVHGKGRSTLFLFPTDVDGPAAWLASGPLDFAIDAEGNITAVSAPHHVEDVCALLAA
jgi:hypothetical protein